VTPNAGRALLTFSSVDSAVPTLRSATASGFLSTLALGPEVGLAAAARDRYDVVMVAEDLVAEHGLALVADFRRAAGDAPVVIGTVASDGAADGTDHGSLPAGAARVLAWGGLRLDTRRRLAWWCGDSLQLTPMQFRLLTRLAAARGAVVPTADLHEAVFADTHVGNGERLFAHVRRVRSLLERDTANPSFLLTVRGEGFRLADGDGELAVAELAVD
jgi:DNA-binding response OmpR family regulator